MKKGANLRIGFISTQFSGTDSISLESSKWSDLFEAAGQDCFWFAGRSDRHPDASMVVSLAHFDHPKIKSINTRVFGKTSRDLETTEIIHRLRGQLKEKLHVFLRRYRLDLLVVVNAVTVPMNIPLGLAITETVAETGIPTIAHHYNFAWGKYRFARNGVTDYLRMAFPPKLPNIEHVVINSVVGEELANRHGISSTVISNMKVLRSMIGTVIRTLPSGFIRLETEMDSPDNVIEFRSALSHRRAAAV